VEIAVKLSTSSGEQTAPTIYNSAMIKDVFFSIYLAALQASGWAEPGTQNPEPLNIYLLNDSLATNIF